MGEKEERDRHESLSSSTAQSTAEQLGSPQLISDRSHPHSHSHLHRHSHSDLSTQEQNLADYDVQAGQRPIREATPGEVGRSSEGSSISRLGGAWSEGLRSHGGIGEGDDGRPEHDHDQEDEEDAPQVNDEPGRRRRRSSVCCESDLTVCPPPACACSVGVDDDGHDDRCKKHLDLDPDRDEDLSSTSTPVGSFGSSSTPVSQTKEENDNDNEKEVEVEAEMMTGKRTTGKVRPRRRRRTGVTTFVDVDGFRYTTDWDVSLDPKDYPKDYHKGDASSTSASTSTPAKPTSITWTEFSPLSPSDPLHYPLSKKYFISTTACLFTLWTSFNASSYAIGEGSMERDLNVGRTEAAAGLALYAWGFAVFPMVLAPFSEE